MRPDRSLGRDGVVGLVAVAAAVCCGLPLLLSLGVGAAIASLGFGDWALVSFGLIAVALGALGVHRRRCRIAHDRKGSVRADSHRSH